jgi:hypothetical protein
MGQRSFGCMQVEVTNLSARGICTHGGGQLPGTGTFPSWGL